MIETIEITESTDNSFKKYIPILTLVCSLVCIVLCIGINLEGKQVNWEVYRKWGSPNVIDIFSGSYWGIISSNFLHVEVWHIACNLYWFWIFGKKIEFETNNFYYGLLILSSALVSNVAQLAFSSSTGIGFSGIVYSLFGFMLIKSKTAEVYKNYLNRKTINLFLAWLVLCIYLTKFNILTIGNAAHMGGLLWGAILAYSTKFHKAFQLTIAAVFLTFLISMIFWSPFSTSYLSFKAYELHKDQKYDEAINVYKIILERDSNSEFAKENLKQFEIQKLSEKAIRLHNELKFNEASQVYNEILRIDNNNEWAKSNLKLIPKELLNNK